MNKLAVCLMALLAGIGQLFLWVIIAGAAIGVMYIWMFIMTKVFGVLGG